MKLPLANKLNLTKANTASQFVNLTHASFNSSAQADQPINQTQAIVANIVAQNEFDKQIGTVAGKFLRENTFDKLVDKGTNLFNKIANIASNVQLPNFSIFPGVAASDIPSKRNISDAPSKLNIIALSEIVRFDKGVPEKDRVKLKEEFIDVVEELASKNEYLRNNLKHYLNGESKTKKIVLCSAKNPAKELLSAKANALYRTDGVLYINFVNTPKEFLRVFT